MVPVRRYLLCSNCGFGIALSLCCSLQQQPSVCRTSVAGGDALAYKAVLCHLWQSLQFIGACWERFFSFTVVVLVPFLTLAFGASVLVWCEPVEEWKVSFYPGCMCIKIKISIVLLYGKCSMWNFFNSFNYCGQLIAATAKKAYSQAFCKCGRLYNEVVFELSGNLL